MRLSHQGRHRRGINFLYNNRTVTVNMEQVQISRDGTLNYSPVNKLLFHEWCQNSKVSKREIIFRFTILAFEILCIDWLIFKIMTMSVKMQKAHRRSPRKCKHTKGNAGANVVNRNSVQFAFIWPSFSWWKRARSLFLLQRHLALIMECGSRVNSAWS